MDLATRSRLILSLALSLLALQSSSAQSTTSQKRPLATVSGTVTIKGKPAVGVTIGLRRDGQPSSNTSTMRGITDQDGNYLISNVPAGRYDVVPGAPAFVLSDVNQPRVKAIFVSEGENVEGIDFTMLRGGVITGRVTDADGYPVIQQQVNIYRADAWEPRPQSQGQPVFAAHGGLTDDRGIYRVFGLFPGRYKVAVGRNDDAVQSPQPPGRASYKRVFHPNVIEPAKATVIEVSEGSEASNVDISLERPVSTNSVAGRIIEVEKNLPRSGIRVALVRLSANRFQSPSNLASGSSNAEGEFVIDGVEPGKYIFSLVTNPGREFTLDSTTVEVTNEDVTGVILRLVKAGGISGVVSIENENPQAIAKLRQSYLTLYVASASGTRGSSGTSIIGSDGSFRIEGLPGGTVGAFSLSGGPGQPPGPIKNFVITRVERDGVAQPSFRFDIKAGEQVTGIRVVVTYGDASLRGSLAVQSGKLPPDARVYVNLVRAGEVPTQIGFNQVDARGHFIIEGVTAGVYELQVNIQSADRTIRRVLRQQVSLTAGATTEVVVTVDLSQP